ncbi:MAG: PhzF family phenazine biosynthesis protein [Firmicutes bacterium]|nr:PhzF family phenazine biosynthesis protein [Bacillota bacterium]
MLKYYCKSFNYGKSGGNPAGVVILGDNEALEEKDMQKMAADIGFSETAFIKHKSGNVYEVRFFTPTTEVDLCGHATIASFYCLAKKNYYEESRLPEQVWQITKAGKLSIQIKYEDNDVQSVLMEQAEPVEYEVLEGEFRKKLAKSLSLEETDLKLEQQEIKPQIISTGLKDIIIPVKSREVLNRIEIDKDLVTEISNELGVVGYHVFTIEEDQIYTRNFAPAVGIDEECATGTSNGALSYLLYSRGIIASYIEILQGETMGELSKVSASVIEEEGRYKVLVGGTAIITDEFQS